MKVAYRNLAIQDPALKAELETQVRAELNAG